MLAALLGLEPVLASGDLEAGDQSLEVPFEGPRQRLVEVVGIEDQMALGGTEDPEVAHVRIPAELRPESGVGRPGQVGSHQQCGAPIEGERRDEHAPVADGDQFGDPGHRLALEELHGIGSQFRGGQQPVRLEGDLATRRLAPGDALGPTGPRAGRHPGDPLLIGVRHVHRHDSRLIVWHVTNLLIGGPGGPLSLVDAAAEASIGTGYCEFLGRTLATSSRPGRPRLNL